MSGPSGPHNLILQIPGVTGVDQCWALDSYSMVGIGVTEVGQLVQRAKYGGLGPPAGELARRLGVWSTLLAAQHHWPGDLVVVPIPSSNGLAEALAQGVAAGLGRPMKYSLKAKASLFVKLLPAQVRPDATRQNVLVRTRDVPKHVLLVDDVLQTGSTMNAAATVLREAGADVVLGLVAAQVTGSGMTPSAPGRTLKR